MSEARPVTAIYPGRSLGWMTLGASLHDVMSRLKAQPQIYPRLDLSYSRSEPIEDPIVLSLPENGIRLRFDGPDQRLRLIEILDFSKSPFSYKSTELVRKGSSSNEGSQDPVQGPSFRHIYNRLFGPSYAGEYIKPESDSAMGTYVLSYPGLAVRFWLKHRSWSEKADFVSLLSSSAASPATSIAIFSGASWPEARATLYTKTPTLPRSISLASKNAELVPDEVEEAVILGDRVIKLSRRTLPALTITLNETTPQDMVAELGPPDAIFRKSGSRLSIHAGNAEARDYSASPAFDSHGGETDHSSSRSYTEDSESDTNNASTASKGHQDGQCFYNYFHHGFDVLVSPPDSNPRSPSATAKDKSELVVSKIVFHANTPGSYSFNRHRRSRWRIETPRAGELQSLTSEMKFAEIQPVMKDLWRDSYRSRDEEVKLQRGMVLNRGWGESPESSIELLGGFEESPEIRGSIAGTLASNGPNASNTELFGFPGLLFEVLKNGAVSCLTVY